MKQENLLGWLAIVGIAGVVAFLIVGMLANA